MPSLIKITLVGAICLSLVVTFFIIMRQSQAKSEPKSVAPTESSNTIADNSIATATLAGGCFWCTESDLEKLPGVISVVSGYAGGEVINPTYKQVATGQTKHIETIQVSYDRDQVQYIDILDYFLRHIDPTDAQGSFVDRGLQYRPAIFYNSPQQQQIAQQFIQQVNAAGINPKPLHIELLPLKHFYTAEDYHQDYYKNNPLRYKYYRHASGRDQYLDKIFGENRNKNPRTLRQIIKGKSGNLIHSKSHTTTKKLHQVYTRPSAAVIKQQLTPLQYQVTQKDKTESPFNNRYWDNKQPGIYVDIVSGEPLFSSTHKFKSGTGWPSFTQPINPNYVLEKRDYKLIIPRTEVRSRYANSHLGHIFKDGPLPTGLRYCVNSAALKFIKQADMSSLGYQHYLYLFND